MQRFAQSPSLEAAPLARTHCSDGPVCRFVSCTRARRIAFPKTVKELVVMAGYRGMFDRTGGFSTARQICCFRRRHLVGMPDAIAIEITHDSGRIATFTIRVVRYLPMAEHVVTFREMYRR